MSLAGQLTLDGREVTLHTLKGAGLGTGQEYTLPETENSAPLADGDEFEVTVRYAVTFVATGADRDSDGVAIGKLGSIAYAKVLPPDIITVERVVRRVEKEAAWDQAHGASAIA